MQQKKRKNKGEEPEKINASFTNQKTEEETKQQGNPQIRKQRDRQ